MALFTESRLTARADRTMSRLRKSADVLLEEASATDEKKFDIFLSHAFKDAMIVLGAKDELESLRYKVYVDWINDPKLDRGKVTSGTATTLRDRMRQCRSLLYLATLNSPVSAWMPWELGFFDGDNGCAAILPIAKNPTDNYSGTEYLGIYPYVDIARPQNNVEEILWVNRSPSKSVPFEVWLADPSKL